MIQLETYSRKQRAKTIFVWSSQVLQTFAPIEVLC
jgi:hypothetical protein